MIHKLMLMADDGLINNRKHEWCCWLLNRIDVIFFLVDVIVCVVGWMVIVNNCGPIMMIVTWLWLMIIVIHPCLICFIIIRVREYNLTDACLWWLKYVSQIWVHFTIKCSSIIHIETVETVQVCECAACVCVVSVCQMWMGI